MTPSPQAQSAYEPDIDDQDALILSGVLELLETTAWAVPHPGKANAFVKQGDRAVAIRAADYDLAVTILKGMIAERW